MAVEFALIAPLLLLLTFGIIGFGYAFHLQSVLDNAARDAVRVFALQQEGDARATARQVATESAQTSVDADLLQIAIPADCAEGDLTTVTVALPDFQLIGGLWTVDLIGSGTMRCSG
ncbi:TadE/TadG family type IV pilus assembly protein [Agrococcus sp. DT81.2]|uniref:TadE/TadG family type IV pilus assembly protein n=1 Tax=Agrococcus sp. DT81.2 TaxID=3393414 RepID=UPI003CE4E0B2